MAAAGLATAAAAAGVAYHAIKKQTGHKSDQVLQRYIRDGSLFRENAAGQPFVFLQGASGWMRREVETGPANHTAVAIRSGLQKGDVVALQHP